MRPGTLLALSVAGVVGLYYLGRRSSASSSSSTSDPEAAIPRSVGEVLEEIVVTARTIVLRKWTPPASAAPYLPHIAAAELKHGIPDQLLGRLLYQESRFRADVIDGRVRGGGLVEGQPGWADAARGIAQIVPKWHPGVDPLDPVESIYYSAGYLRTLRREFGDWEKALAAYNWGWGRLEVALAQHGENWLASAPTETRNYVSQITADVPVQVA